ncbi:hypothetical protein EZV62_002801 [Acer yangbiense]|uniref:UDP-glycosyltransferases domain-containing protein n=1 Tax=Acer yangbiense TaxID=1000413 RepID=A0A5C7J059_9ROSI|nr:hypothetical protein EZV62_002801 [Acer yangbiense]
MEEQGGTIEVLIEMIEEQQLERQDHQELPCIIYDLLVYSAEAVAHHLKLPSIVLQTSSVASVLSYYICPEIKKEGYTPFQESKSLELVPELYPLRFKDLPVFNVKSVDDFQQFVTTALNLRTSCMILNSIDCLEQQSLMQLRQKLQVPIFLIGPMHKLVPVPSSSLLEEDRSYISWLDKQTDNSVLYVSFGSIAAVEEKELAEMAWGLANSKQPFLWVLRPGSVRMSESVDSLLDDFKETVGERGCIVKWAPQKEVLAHSAVGGFWSHCGWNSTLESVSEGVPMICRPFTADQKVLSRYVSQVWRVGIELENVFERGEIERAIKLLMVEKGEEIRQRAAELKLELQLSVQKGGSSYNSLNELVEFIVSVYVGIFVKTKIHILCRREVFEAYWCRNKHKI